MTPRDARLQRVDVVTLEDVYQRPALRGRGTVQTHPLERTGQSPGHGVQMASFPVPGTPGVTEPGTRSQRPQRPLERREVEAAGGERRVCISQLPQQIAHPTGLGRFQSSQQAGELLPRKGRVPENGRKRCLLLCDQRLQPSHPVGGADPRARKPLGLVAETLTWHLQTAERAVAKTHDPGQITVVQLYEIQNVDAQRRHVAAQKAPIRVPWQGAFGIHGNVTFQQALNARQIIGEGIFRRAAALDAHQHGTGQREAPTPASDDGRPPALHRR